MEDFITRNDYLPMIKEQNLLAMLEQDENILATEELSAIEMVRSYLFEQYETDTIFATTGENRNRHLVRLCVNVVLYYLYQRIPRHRGQAVADTLVEKNYAESLTFLERVSEGKVSLDLPRRQRDEDTATRFRWGSDEKRSHTF